MRKTKIKRDVQPNEILQPDDTILRGTGKLLDEFNCQSAKLAIEKTLLALKKLDDLTHGACLTCLTSFEQKYKERDFDL